MFVNDGGGAPTTGGVVNSISASMDDFAHTAASGGFTVNESGGQALIGAIDRLLEWVNGSALDMQLIEQQPQLGGSGAAKVVSPFAQKVATDHEGFLTVLAQLRESLNTAKSGINTAMANYQQDDTGNAGRFQQA